MPFQSTDYPEAVASRGAAATVAAAGSTATDATVLSADNNSVSAADGSVGARLPSNGKGRRIAIWNSVNGQNLKVYPPTGGKIDDGTTDASQNLAGLKSAMYFAVTDLLWYRVLTA